MDVFLICVGFWDKSTSKLGVIALHKLAIVTQDQIILTESWVATKGSHWRGRGYFRGSLCLKNFIGCAFKEFV